MMMLYKALPKQPPVIEEQQTVEESRVPLNLEGAASKASTPQEYGSITPSSEPVSSMVWNDLYDSSQFHI